MITFKVTASEMNSLMNTSKESLTCKISALSTSNYQKQSPLLNKMYLLRYILSKAALKVLTTDHWNVKNQIISLGAGLDNSLETLTDFKCTDFFSVDFDEVIDYRRNLYRDNINPKSKLISCDIRDVNKLIRKLIEYNFDFECKSIVILECVGIYIFMTVFQIDYHHITRMLSR